ncbi:MAG: methyltransferase domain-containing protein [Candidatus Sulfotelmatobacter sp.]
MITRSDDYVEYCRETARHASDAHDLALRGRDKKEITRVIHERIAEAVNLHSGDDLVDIGCGDGTLLRIAERVGARSAIGLLATDEEVAVLRRFGLEARQALTDKLPLPDQCASVIVCNSVLLVVPREKIQASLAEIYRIARPGARIFLGEIPFVQPSDPTPQFNTRWETLAYLYRKHGLRTWFGMLRRMAWWALRGQPAVLRPGTAISFFAKPDEFIAMGQEAGLEFVRYWQHSDPDTRNNYLFRKAG